MRQVLKRGAADWSDSARRAVGLAALLATASLPAMACAQSEPEAAGQSARQADDSADAHVEDIVVTAQKRSENLQTVPISIQAFTPRALASTGTSNVAQLGNFVPNISFEKSSPIAGSSQILSAYIRGIGQDDIGFQFEPGVGIYIDGVYLARNVGAAVDLLDVERVEVLKGPQGTLFGRNAIGGAVSIVSRDPSDTFKAQGELTYGRFNRFESKGALDVPLSENLLSQVSFSLARSDGYVHRLRFPGIYTTDTDRLIGPGRTNFGTGGVAVAQNAPDTEGGQNSQTVRIKLQFKPSDSFKATLIGDYSHADEQSITRSLIGTSTEPGQAGEHGLTSVYNACISLPVPVLAMIGLYNPANQGGVCGIRSDGTTLVLTDGVTPTVPGQGLPPLAGVNFDADPSNDRLPYDSRFVTGDPDITYANGPNYSKLNAQGLTLTLDWHAADWVDIKSITGYRHFKLLNGTDMDGSPLEVLDLAYKFRQHQLSEELQFSGRAVSDKLKWVAGLYAFNETGQSNDYINVFGGLLGQYPGTVHIDFTSYAAFTQSTFQLTDKLSITGGIRYTHENKDLDFTQRDINLFLTKLVGIPRQAFPYPNTDPILLNPTDVLNRKFNNVSYKIGPELQLNPNAFFYGSLSTGFKSGGYNARILGPIHDFATVDQNGELFFGPEKAKQWEIGAKLQFFDRRLRTNIALFTTDYTNIQVTAYNAGGAPYVTNAGNARIKGVELDWQAVPVEGLRLSGGVGYLDAKYTTLRQGVPLTLNSLLNKAPKWSANVVADYEAGLQSGAAIILHADYFYKSRQATNSDNNPLLIDNSESLGAYIGYRAPSGRWELLAGGRNLTNDRSVLNGYSQPGSLGVTSAAFTRPREWFLTLKFHD